MVYSEFKQNIAKIDELLKASGVDESKVEIGISDHENKKWDIERFNISIDVNEAKSETNVIIISE